jgi:ribonuclease HI
MLSNFPNSLLVFTDGSVSTSSAGFSFYIPTLKISFSSKINSLASSYTTECYAIINALQFIFSLEFNNFLIVSDSQSCLLAIASDSFNPTMYGVAPRQQPIKKIIIRYLYMFVGVY